MWNELLMSAIEHVLPVIRISSPELMNIEYFRACSQVCPQHLERLAK